MHKANETVNLRMQELLAT